MNHSSFKAIAMFCVLIGGVVALECGPLATHACAQRGDDEGDRPREERGGWRRFRRNRDGEDDRRDRGRERDRDNDNEDRDRRNRGRENRDGDGESSFDTADYARTLLRERDKNGNKVLDGDEVSQLRGRAAGADLNNDKVITAEELIARFSDRAAAGSGSGQANAKSATGTESSGASGKSATGKPTRVYTSITSPAASKDDKSTAAKRRSYRFTPGGERVITGLPSWFKSRDRNSDGQVAMSEYSRSWSRRMVSEFRRYDLNDDGVITPKEAAK
jgi:hypothetical protein